MLKGINRVPKRQADGTVKIYFYHRATSIRPDSDRLVETYADAEKRTRRQTDKTLTDLIRFFD